MAPVLIDLCLCIFMLSDLEDLGDTILNSSGKQKIVKSFLNRFDKIGGKLHLYILIVGDTHLEGS